MPSQRREIHDKLIDILKSISIANGYQQTIVSVTKRMKEIEHLSSFPELSVIEGEQVLQCVSEEENLYEVTSSFAAIGYIKTGHDSNDQGLLSSASDDLIEDIKEALLANTGDLIATTSAKSLRLSSDEPILDYQNNWGYVTVYFTVTYYFEGTA